MELDLILLAIEALVLGGSEAILEVANELELREIIKNRVVLWQLRSTNPLRRLGQRRSMGLLEAKALVAIICNLAKRLVVTTRQLLIDYQQLQDKQIPLEHHLRLSDYVERFRSYFRSRMNPRRTEIYTSDAELERLALTMLGKLLFCTGTFGMQRFWISLFDGEVE
jgi:HAMP domain-containing protein